MNYFDFYSIPVSFHPDEAALKKQFYAMSKAFHPDFHAGESEEKQAEVLEQSTLNNKAWQTLSQFDKRLHYVLEVKGMLADGDKYQLPQSFLMEMMEVNEGLMDLEMEGNDELFQQLNGQVAAMEGEIAGTIQEKTTHFEKADSAEQQQLLETIKDLYYRKKYLLRIRDSLNRFAAR